jgi:hypothetical protein
MTPPAKRVYLHIGAPKTGTTYLQDVLFRNRAALAEQGLLVPGGAASAHYEAALDLRALAFGGYRDPRAEGAWAELVEQVMEWNGRAAVISHELLSGADDEAMARAVASFADPSSATDARTTEVHVIYTARDLGRQVPAMWQESVKHGQDLPYGTYLRRLSSRRRRGRAARIFWRQQHLAEVLERWSAHVPAERLHVVLVPPPGRPNDVLWRRFASVLGVRTEGLDLAVERTNVSLGLAEAELLRRVNEVLDDLAWPEYGPTVKFWFAEQVLAQLTSGPRATVPRSMHRWLEQQATLMTSALEESGWDVVGDLSDLHPVIDAGETSTEQAGHEPPGRHAADREPQPAEPGGARFDDADDPVDAANQGDPGKPGDPDDVEETDDDADAPRDPRLEPTDAEVLAVATQALGMLLRERARMLGKRGAGPRPPQTLPDRLVQGAARARQLLRRRWVAARARNSSAGR